MRRLFSKSMKSDIRKALLALRKLIPKEERKEASVIIERTVMETPQWQKAKTVCIYLSRSSEVDTKELITDAKEQMKTVLFPAPGVQADLFIVPGVAFDRSGNRLGRGGGFYDRLLAHSQAAKIGLAFEIQIIDKVPSAAYDVQMDMVITERSTYKNKTS